MEKIKVAVIGLGPAGLTAVKALREEGFDVIAFERRDRVGGVWSYSQDTNFTTVTRGTVANSGFSDFPIPDEYPPYMTGDQVAEYFEAYAQNFGLEDCVKFKTTVRRVLRDDHDRKWNVHFTSADGVDHVIVVDKVVVGSGSNTTALWPPLPGRSLFEGTVLHGQSYRGPEPFADRRVLVVGMGNTACEISLSLIGHASRVYQSYRRGRYLVPRFLDSGVPSDCSNPWPMLCLQDMLDYRLPGLAGPLVDRDARRAMITRCWRLLPCASMAHVHPIAQDHFIPALHAGHVIPLHSFERFVGASAVRLNNDTDIEVDAVIFCTGYALDFGILPELEMDGACGLPLVTAGEVFGAETLVKGPGEDSSTGSGATGKEPHLPRLFHNIFPPRWASSLAILSWMSPIQTAWCVAELASMAVSQLWAAEAERERGLGHPPISVRGRYRKPARLPSEAEMNAAVDGYHTWWRRQRAKEPSAHPGLVRTHTLYRFLHDKAGTGMYDHLDHPFTLRGWQLRCKDGQLFRWLAKGPANSYAWRLFETNPAGIPGCGRRTWVGARNAVEDAYVVYEQYKRDVEDHELRRRATEGTACTV
ncbi:hypothetical protein RJ55_01026 [Drechmeria coniospora]|nr:hypothetical protein RJ55_01026 [Drechmeria coniospora]